MISLYMLCKLCKTMGDTLLESVCQVVKLNISHAEIREHLHVPLRLHCYCTIILCIQTNHCLLDLLVYVKLTFA